MSGLFHIDPETGAAGIENAGAALRKLRSLVPVALVGECELEVVAQRVDDLPASVLGFELRLGHPAPRADCLLGLMPGSAAEQAHCRRGLRARPDSREAAFAHHLARIRETGFPGSVQLKATILEFDVPTIPDEAPLPAPGVFQGWWLPASRNSGIRDPQVAGSIAAAIGAAVGRTEDAREVAAVRKAVASLPPGGRLTWIGAMPDRQPRATRLLFRGFEVASLSAGLEAMGWSGPGETVATVIDCLEGHFGRLAIQLEVSARGVLPGLGLEVYVLEEDPAGGAGADWAAAPNPALWRATISRLQDAGWCLPEKAAALLSFPGREFIFHESVFLAHKGINHIKISIDECGRCTAKAYVGMQLRPVGAQPSA